MYFLKKSDLHWFILFYSKFRDSSSFLNHNASVSYLSMVLKMYPDSFASLTKVFNSSLASGFRKAMSCISSTVFWGDFVCRLFSLWYAVAPPYFKLFVDHSTPHSSSHPITFFPSKANLKKIYTYEKSKQRTPNT